MNIEQIKYFIETANCKKINRAADNLYISQSTLKSSLSKFEEELGYRVFLRSKKGVELTDKGKDILEEAEKIIQFTERWKNLGKNYNTGSIVRVFAPPIARTMVINNVLLSARELYDITVAIFSENGQPILSTMMENSTSIVLNLCERQYIDKVIFHAKELGMEYEVVYQDKGFLYVNGALDIPVEIDLNKMKDYELVSYSSREMHYLFSEQSKLFAKKIPVASSVDQWDMIKKNKNMVGFFTNLISLDKIEDMQQGKIKRAKIKNLELRMDWILCFPKASKQTMAQKYVIDLIRQAFANIEPIADYWL